MDIFVDKPTLSILYFVTINIVSVLGIAAIKIRSAGLAGSSAVLAHVALVLANLLLVANKEVFNFVSIFLSFACSVTMILVFFHFLPRPKVRSVVIGTVISILVLGILFFLMPISFKFVG